MFSLHSMKNLWYSPYKSKLYRRLKYIPNCSPLASCLVLWLTLGGSNYHCQAQSDMVRKMFELFKFDYSCRCKRNPINRSIPPIPDKGFLCNTGKFCVVDCPVCTVLHKNNNNTIPQYLGASSEPSGQSTVPSHCLVASTHVLPSSHKTRPSLQEPPLKVRVWSDREGNQPDCIFKQIIPRSSCAWHIVCNVCIHLRRFTYLAVKTLRNTPIQIYRNFHLQNLNIFR